MPVNGMNVGSDYSLSYYDAVSGGLINLGDVEDVKITPLKHDVKSMPYNNDPKYGYVPDGFKIDFSIVRTGSVLESLLVTILQNFKNGVVQSAGFLNQTTNNPDGTVSRFQYQGFVVFPTDLGQISRDKVVKQSLEGMASTMIQIA